MERSEVKVLKLGAVKSTSFRKACRNACGLPAGTCSHSYCSQSKISQLLSVIPQPLYTLIYLWLSSLRGPELNTIFQAASARHENMLEK